MSKTRINELQSLVARLQANREAHVAAIAEIDAAFESFGLPTMAGGKKRKVTQKKKARGKVSKKTTKRRKFRTTANDLVLGMIKRAGAKGATGAQIDKAWKTAKRPGDAYNTLSTLAKAKKIKRRKVKGARGSRYSAK